MKRIRKWFQRMKEEERGVTLIELLAVIVILGIIAAIGIPAILNSRDQAQQATYESNAKILEESAKRKIISGQVYAEDVSDDEKEFNLEELLTDSGIETDDGTVNEGVNDSDVVATYVLGDDKGTYSLDEQGHVKFSSSSDDSSDDTSDDESSDSANDDEVDL